MEGIWMLACHFLRHFYLFCASQAEVGGQKVTWLTPHVLSQVLPSDVDFRVMLTFVEFYEVCLLPSGILSFTMLSYSMLPALWDCRIEAP
jgi:pescadillo protein